jgi:hypothetical protein
MGVIRAKHVQVLRDYTNIFTNFYLLLKRSQVKVINKPILLFIILWVFPDSKKFIGVWRS